MADDRIPELVTDLQDQVEHKLIALRIDARTAKTIGVEVAAYITTNWGGQLIYIPKNLNGQLSARDVQIYAQFNGRNHAALAKKFDLTVQQIYRIVREVGERERAKNQGDLFAG